jgi:hypothetical protein
MSDTSLRTVVVKYSITNSDEVDYKDTVAPFSFLDFINNTQADYSPEEYSSSYSSYLKAWHSNQGGSVEEQKIQFTDYYRQFIKEIVVNYTTETEKRFLQKIDFNDPADLDVAIPFFANRLKDIALFYKKKRDESKYVIDRVKMKGSQTGLEKAIFDNIYNFIFNSEDALDTENDEVFKAVQGLGVEVEEFIDVYGDYFDVPDTADGNNINEVDPKYWLDPNAINAINGMNFMGAIRSFTINAPPITTQEFDAICDPDNALVELYNQYKKGGIPLNEFYALKRALVQKYIGTDFYYIDTTTFPATSGLMFTADNPAANALNLQGADTATVQSNQQKLLRDVGLNFQPDDIGLFKLQAETYNYEIDMNLVQEDKVYIFPDPAKFGNVSTNPQASYPVFYKFDYRGNTRNVSSGFAAGDPRTTNKATTFESYTTKERNSTQLEDLNDISYKLNFTDLYNEGLVEKHQTDVYGNEYALFKYEPLKPRGEDISNTVKNLLLNGHLFFDPFEGNSFDYSLTGQDGNTFRSGLSTNTNGFDDITLDNPLWLYMREFYPYQDLIQDSRNLIPLYRDGGALTFLDGNKLPDNANGNSHYTVRADATVDQNSEFFPDVKYFLSAGIGYKDYDGGFFTDDVQLPNDFIYSDNLRYVDTTDERGSTVLSDLSSSATSLTNEEKATLDGTLYIKNGTFSTSEKLSAALNPIISKYSTTVQSQLNHELVDFDIIQNTIFLETKSGLLVDKIKYVGGEFVKPSTVNTYYPASSADNTDTFTNRFYVERTGKIYFGKFKQDGECTNEADNYKAYYPEIYEYTIDTNKSRLVYPREDVGNSVTDFELNVTSNTDRNYVPTSIHTPTIAYNSRNDLFKLTYIANDMNDFTHLVDVSFKLIDNALSAIDSNRYETQSNINRTTTFGNKSNFSSISANGGTYTRDQDNFNITI